jgi:hypothetical protein
MALCDTFQALAVDTWDWFRENPDRTQWPGEDSITDGLMRALRRACPGQVVVHRFNQIEEGRTTGADFVMWLCSRAGGVGLRVQAKRISQTLDRYSKLWYKDQFDLLVGDAQRYGLYPMYCFYNYWEHVPTLPWLCGTNRPDRVDLLGCGLASTYSLQSLRSTKDNKLASVANHIWPWSCLVCCAGHLPGGDLAERASAWLLALHPSEEEFTGNVHSELPGYVTAILQG